MVPMFVNRTMDFELNLDRKFSIQELENLTYRSLQQIAKAHGLPSNVKKIFLIQLIFTKTNKSPSELESIVRMVKWERQKIRLSNNMKKGDKKRLQGKEITSTNNCVSPPIDLTPRRSMSSSSPESQTIKTPTKALISYRRVNQNQMTPKKSDRVLRSTIRSYKKPNYSFMNDSMIEVIEQCESQSRERVSIMRESRYPKMKMTARCLVRKTRPNVLQRGEKRIMPALTDQAPHQSTSSVMIPVPSSSLVPTKRPINTICVPKNTQAIFQSISFRHSDGKITNINAIVQKQTPKTYALDYQLANSTANVRKVEVMIQDLNNSIDEQTLPSSSDNEYRMTESLDYPNMTVSSDCTVEAEDDVLMPVEMNSGYSHESFSSEVVREKETLDIPRNTANEQPLPNIQIAFSKTKDFSQPLYVQTEDTNVGMNDWVLETFFNIRVNEDPVPSHQTASTNCVFSTSTICTPLQQHTNVPADFHNSSYERVTSLGNFCASTEVSRVHEDANSEQDIALSKYRAANSSNSSLDSQLGATVTISEMVEDALELISQDGDYMERISMDLRMQCVLCSWAGPKFVLERHIREEHSDQIVQEEKGEWVVTYKLGSLVNQPVWMSTICERSRGAHLYVLSVKYTDPNCFMASLTALSPNIENKMGTITIYNKVTGEPFVWQGLIQELPYNMPYENIQDCLQLDLSKLELLPNSANLKLHNRSWVLNSPSKVVVGQPELNDIHIITFVRIQDSDDI